MSDIISQDAVLSECNETELLQLAWKQKLGHLKRGIPREELVAIVSGQASPEPRHMSPTEQTRDILQGFIERNFEKLRSQLPGCDGKCKTFHCTEGKHAMCLYPNKGYLG
jgi:hypothetical protein